MSQIKELSYVSKQFCKLSDNMRLAIDYKKAITISSHTPKTIYEAFNGLSGYNGTATQSLIDRSKRCYYDFEKLGFTTHQLCNLKFDCECCENPKL